MKLICDNHYTCPCFGRIKSCTQDLPHLIKLGEISFVCNLIPKKVSYLENTFKELMRRSIIKGENK